MIYMVEMALLDTARRASRIANTPLAADVCIM